MAIVWHRCHRAARQVWRRSVVAGVSIPARSPTGTVRRNGPASTPVPAADVMDETARQERHGHRVAWLGLAYLEPWRKPMQTSGSIGPTITCRRGAPITNPTNRARNRLFILPAASSCPGGTRSRCVSNRWRCSLSRASAKSQCGAYAHPGGGFSISGSTPMTNDTCSFRSGFLL